MADILFAVISLINLYRILLVARILLTWLPNINWYNQPFRFLSAITDPLLAPFRRLIPAIGGFDISPILLFFALELLQQALVGLANNMVFRP